MLTDNSKPGVPPAARPQQDMDEGDVFTMALALMKPYPASYRVFKAELERLRNREAPARPHPADPRVDDGKPEIELRLDREALGWLSLLVREHRLKLKPESNPILDVLQDGVDRLLLQTIKIKRVSLLGEAAVVRPHREQQKGHIAFKRAIELQDELKRLRASLGSLEQEWRLSANPNDWVNAETIAAVLVDPASPRGQEPTSE